MRRRFGSLNVEYAVYRVEILGTKILLVEEHAKSTE